MAKIILSQTLVLSGGKMEQCKKLRICSKVDSKGIAVASAWRDADKDLPIQSAKDELEALGYKESQDFIRVTLIGKGRAHRTRIVRMTKITQTAIEAENKVAELPAPISPTGTMPTPEPKKKGARKSKGKKNAEQIDQQLHEQMVEQLAGDGFCDEAIDQMMSIIEESIH